MWRVISTVYSAGKLIIQVDIITKGLFKENKSRSYKPESLFKSYLVLQGDEKELLN
mgnify:FL=1